MHLSFGEELRAVHDLAELLGLDKPRPFDQGLTFAGGDPNSEDYDRRTPLHIACAEGNMTAAKTLIDHGANISAEDRWKHTPLSEAEDGGHDHIAAMIREHTSRSTTPYSKWQGRVAERKKFTSEVHRWYTFGNALGASR
eukprot:scaffold459_cov391-Prasinococcus_capsulatus_cf.AAC.6